MDSDTTFATILDAICCVMFADRKATAQERQAVCRAMHELGCSYTSRTIDELTREFVIRAKRIGLRRMIEDVGQRLELLDRKDQAAVIPSILQTIALADGRLDESERQICE